MGDAGKGSFLSFLFTSGLTFDQEMLPGGATLLGIILSSDKTNMSVMTGDRTAHPVLLSLANIHADVRMKSSNCTFILVTLLPCPKFITKDKGIRGILDTGGKGSLTEWVHCDYIVIF